MKLCIAIIQHTTSKPLYFTLLSGAHAYIPETEVKINYKGLDFPSKHTLIAFMFCHQSHFRFPD